jgi:UDP-N-acetylmuramoyl-tripeptide--D-alanyl-D-alanine ligase
MVLEFDCATVYPIFQSAKAVCTDSRQPTDNCLFFALSGQNFNGNHFAQQVLDNGALAIVCDDEAIAHALHTINQQIVFIAHDSLQALQDLAHYHRQQFNIPVLAITGTNGKTTTKELINAVLSSTYRVHCTQGNLNNHIGVPLTLLAMPLDTEIAIIEMGANHIGEIASYCVYAQPTHGIITNIGKAHLEGFGSLEGVKIAKGELYSFLKTHQGTIFYNKDLPILQDLIQTYPNVISYGHTTMADFVYTTLTDRWFASIQYNNSRIDGHLIGHYNAPNMMAAVTIGLHFNMSLATITHAIDGYQPRNNRSQLITKGDHFILMDAYNANPSSMEAAIKNFVDMDVSNKILWLGSMKEMGSVSDAEHQKLIDQILQHQWYQVVLVGSEFKNVPKTLLHFSTVEEAIQFVSINQLPKPANILIKGSRSTHMDKLLELWPT